MDFSIKLIDWYSAHKRDLPWRRTRNPYKIWISEIVLQQTRVNQGIHYYRRFIEKYPDVHALASASEDEVLKLWQGLGYYSRARNLHAAARFISNELDGNFPTDIKSIRSLKGVGEYTAAAIASFAYNKAYPVVDGNVYRVLSRVFSISTPIDSSAGTKVFKEKANSLIDKKQPGLFNQALMEFGALHCTPRSPSCEDCCFQTVCEAFRAGSIHMLPVKSKRIKQKKRYFNYLFIRNGNDIFLKRRAKGDIWQNLYEFPLIETPGSAAEKEIVSLEQWKAIFFGTEAVVKKVSDLYRHTLTHQKIYARFWEIDIPDNNNYLDERCIKVNVNRMDKYAIPRLIEKFLEKEILHD